MLKTTKYFSKINFNPKTAIYPAVSVILFILVIFSFVKNISFLSKELNQAANFDEKNLNPTYPKLDTKSFNAAAKISGFQITSSTEANLKIPVPQEPASTTTTTEKTVVTPEATTTQLQIFVGKNELSVEIYNSTRLSGSAGKVSQLLEKNSFTIAKTGNSSPTLPTTEIKIKKGSGGNPAIIELFTLVKSLYASATILETETQTSDIVIVIGNK